MPRSDLKPSKKSGQSFSSKTLSEQVQESHEGSFDPSEKTGKASSSKKRSGVAEDSRDPNETRNHQSYTSGGKGKDLDPTGHEGDYDPSAIRLRTIRNHKTVPMSDENLLEPFHSSPLQEGGKAGKANDPLRHYHRDLLGRKFIGYDNNDKFLNPHDGRLCSLVVQSSRDVQDSNPGATWYRRGLRNGSPWMIRISNWAMSRDHGAEATIGPNFYTAAGRWIPACLALSLVTILPIQVAATPSNFGRYDPFLYKDWRYPLDARNKFENRVAARIDNQRSHVRPREKPSVGKRERLAEPDFLCFVGADNKVEQFRVSDWTEDQNRMTPTGYVFISFTGQHLASDKLDDEYLREVGKHAARALGVHAYWISRSCLYDYHEEDKEVRKRQKVHTVWNMSDIIRRARAVAIAVPGPLDAQCNGESLREWGNRVWTMPELLLYTGSNPILIYEKTKRLDQRRMVPRRELWNKVWSDTAFSGQLIDHYEGSLHLTPLELNTVALHCLQNRYTTEYLKGDLAYILMGLQRQRPEVVASDTEFQAFARLSLANDSNLLLERMICLLPNSLDAEWWSLEDAWNATLWDIYPKTQICGIGDGDTMIIDGARGAAIRWDKFAPVRTLQEETMRHRLVRWTLRTLPAFFPLAIVLVILSRRFSPLETILSGTMLAFSCTIFLLLPYLTRQIYCTKTHDSQPFFFGIEGYLDKYNLELLVFGSYEGRLHWSTAGSPLSRHSLDEKGMEADFSLDKKSMGIENMYTGLDPVKDDSDVRNFVKKAKGSSHQDKKVFTLVDTYTMTVTLFEAVRPPIAVVICGAEGGMQRALLCSEDWTTGTLYRETVLRMETRVWDKTDTMARVRLGLKREDMKKAIRDPRSFVIVEGPWWKRLANAIAVRI